MKRLLITGASGFIGWNLCQLSTSEWEVYGTYFCNTLDITNVNMLSVYLTDIHTLKSLFIQIKTEAVIHTAAQSQPNVCQNNTQESHVINVKASCDIARLCADAKIPYIFTFTDLVFYGYNPP
ncbi:dTDP-4-dehydrorhamnose reductase [Richelia intracellularis]|nr:dTDP-4-dehydrorhamnose reductase [Richelia intracellularis]